MSLPFAGETVTLVRRIESIVASKTYVTYATVILTGCSWRRTMRYNRDDKTLIPYEGITCRVPAGQSVPHAGDLLILGAVEETVTSGAEYQALIERYRDTGGAFFVASVADNARPGMPMPHYAARS